MKKEKVEVMLVTVHKISVQKNKFKRAIVAYSDDYN